MTLNNDDLLVSAAGAGRLSDVRELLEKGANIEARDSDGYTSLHRAAEGGHLEIIRFLIDKGANIGAKNKDGGKPLDVANTSRQSEVVNFLGPKQSEYDRLLFAAVESGNVSEVTNLLNIGASIEVKGVENAEFRLARYVKRIMEMSNYHNVHSEKKSELERIKGELPESVKNAVFSSEVCIKSVYYSNEYLYPASDYLSHDRDRRRVFTWRPGGKDSSCQWKFEPEGNNIYIKSTYFNEYLYPAGNGLSHDRDRRRVFTWRPGGKDSSCQWKFEDCGSTRKKRDVQYSITKEAKCDLSYDNASDNSSQSDEIGYNKIGATSGASKPSSWIDAVKGVFQFISSPLRAALPSFSENSSSRSGTAGSSSNHSDTVRNPNIQYTSQFSREVCASNNASLMFFLLQAFLDKKCPLPKFSDVNPVKALFYTSDIIKSFKEVLEKQAESKGGIKMHRLDINFEKLFEKINEKIRSGEFNEISGILKSYAEEALPGREPGDPGRLSPKKFDKFMAEFNRRIDPVINQLMQQMLSRLEVSDVKEQQISLEPKSYLNNTSVQCHLTQARGQGKVLIP